MSQPKVFRNGNEVGYLKRILVEKVDVNHPSANIILYTDDKSYSYRYMESYCNRTIEGVKVNLSDALSLDEENVNVYLTEYLPNEVEDPCMEILEVEIENGPFDGWKFIFELDIVAK